MLVWLLLVLPLVFSMKRHMDNHFAPDDIIELPVGRFPDPDCEYSVHSDGPSGAKISGQVKVGDAVYHQWKCSHGEKDSNLFCMMVHNCTVSSSRNSTQQVPILDEFGCSLFPTVLPHVEYPDDLRGGLFVHAFSLDVDKAAVFFECNVKLLLKLNGVCRRPTCPSLESLQKGQKNRFRRFIRNN